MPLKTINLRNMGVVARKDRIKFKLQNHRRIPTTLRQDRAYSTANLPNFPRKDTIDRDVCIIGGGATGTFAAIRLRDLGKSVAVIEQKDRLGGHTLTYHDKATGLKTEAGVVVIRKSTIANQFFSRFNIPLVKFDPPPPEATVFVDFTTGKPINFAPSDPTEAFAVYATHLAKYPFLDNGFDLPDPVPPNLLIPFGNFVEKFNLSPIVFSANKLGQGLGNLLSQPTLYVMKNFGATALRGFAEGFLATENNDNSELYEKAREELDDDAILSSRVISTWRDHESATVLVQTPSGQRLIRAKKLLITIPPRLDNLQGFDLDTKEKSLFGQLNNSAYWTFLLRNTGTPDNHYLINMNLKTKENLPTLPGIYEISPTGIPNLVNLKYGSPVALPDKQVKEDVMATISRLQSAGTIQTATPEISLFSSHTPFELTVPASAIAAGFYKKLNTLHGHRSTFYTGAAFQTHDASLLWEYTDTILRRLTRS